MAWLYQNAAVVLFTSTVEGLGMPILEAVEFNKPVVCSDVDIFRELHGAAFDFCDPYEAESIEAAINRSFKRGLTIDSAAYQKIPKSYSWTKTARRLLDELSQPPVAQLMKKPKIAVFAPTPDGYSAIGKVVQEQHYELSRRADVDYYLEAGLSDKAKRAKLRENLLPFVAKVMDPWQFDATAQRRYDKVIYHIGNSEYHPATLIKALSFPASVVIHDPTIKNLYGVAHAEGLLGKRRVAAEGRLHELVRPREAEFLTSLLSRQTEVVTHSAHMNEAVEESLPKVVAKRPKITKLNLTTAIPYRVDINHRAKNDFTVVIAGLVHEAKGLAVVKKIAKLKLPRKALIIKIVGFPLLLESTEAKLRALSGVQLIYAPSDARFLQELHSADVVLSYRPNYQGEPSLAVLEALRLGKAVIVNKQGWFDQLPEGLVYKARTAAEAVKLIVNISREDQTVAAKRRIQYIENNHRISTYTESLLEDID
jgi:glycosyltransferase involved in cell wall biosynthesis